MEIDHNKAGAPSGVEDALATARSVEEDNANRPANRLLLGGLIQHVPEGGAIAPWHGGVKFDMGTTTLMTAVMPLNLVLRLIWNLYVFAKSGNTAAIDPHEAWFTGYVLGKREGIEEAQQALSAFAIGHPGPVPFSQEKPEHDERWDESERHVEAVERLFGLRTEQLHMGAHGRLVITDGGRQDYIDTRGRSWMQVAKAVEDFLAADEEEAPQATGEPAGRNVEFESTAGVRSIHQGVDYTREPPAPKLSIAGSTLLGSELTGDEAFDPTDPEQQDLVRQAVVAAMRESGRVTASHSFATDSLLVAVVRPNAEPTRFSIDAKGGRTLVEALDQAVSCYRTTAPLPSPQAAEVAQALEPVPFIGSDDQAAELRLFMERLTDATDWKARVLRTGRSRPAVELVSESMGGWTMHLVPARGDTLEGAKAALVARYNDREQRLAAKASREST